MANTPDQEAEEIRNGLDQVMKDAERPLLEAMIAQVCNYPIPQNTRNTLIEIGTRLLTLRRRRAVLQGQPVPAIPAWLDGRASATVTKATIVDRLQVAGKLQAFSTALGAASLYNRMRWDARVEFRSDDAPLLAAFNGIDADPAVIFAPE